MRAVPSRDTSAELKVRRALHPIAPGYRLHRKDILGKPDIAFVGRKQAIFVHGCFWHGHNCKRGARVPKTNVDYWMRKIGRNRERDEANLKTLKNAGWRTLIVWECQTKDTRGLAQRLSRFVAH